MRKMPLQLLIPMIAIMIVVGVAAAYRLYSSSSAVPAKAKEEYPNALTNTQETKPSTFLGGLGGAAKATPTPTPGSTNDLSTELKATYDDGGQAELDALAKEAAAL
jgi:hypothetical protein